MMKLLLTVLLAATVCVSAKTNFYTETKLKDGSVQRSRSVDPMLCDPNVKQYASYFDLENRSGQPDKHYFSWTFESRDKPATDPVVLWMTGGPGCSSELALFVENGPCKVNADGTTTTPNKYSWNNHANLVYIDQPANVGFSWGGPGAEDSNEKEVADDMYHFLQQFYRDHPQWRENELYIFGESYGGHFAPATAHRVVQGNQNLAPGDIKLPLVGLAVGNGLTDPKVQYQYYPQMIYNYTATRLGQPLVSEQTYAEMTAGFPKCRQMISDCQHVTGECGSAQAYCNELMFTPYEMTGRNTYDIRKQCTYPPLCYNFDPVTKFLNSPAVLQQLNVTHVQQWSDCNFQVNGMFRNDWMKDYQEDIPLLLANKIRVLIYAGDCDFICNWIGNKAWATQFKWPFQKQFAEAKDRKWQGKDTAIVRTADHLTFLQIHDAGHMVPMDQPAVALDMLTTFLTNGKF